MCHWRALLQCTIFRGGRPCNGDSTRGIGSLSDLTAAGARLQRMMLTLKQTVEDSEDAVFACKFMRLLLTLINSLSQLVKNITKLFIGLLLLLGLAARQTTTLRLMSQLTAGM